MEMERMTSTMCNNSNEIGKEVNEWTDEIVALKRGERECTSEQERKE